MLDFDKYPRDDELSVKEEFFAIISKFPKVKAHLADMKPTMDFVRSDRLQYSANASVGHRHFLTNNTYGFIDALYSNGLVHTFESIFQGASLLLSAFGKMAGEVRPGDFSAEAFAPLEALHKAQWEQADFLISNAYRAMGSFATWNAWTQLWLANILFHDIWLQRACFHYFSSKSIEAFSPFLKEIRPGMDAPFVQEKNELLAQVDRALGDAESGRISSEMAAEQILNALQEQEWLPKHVYAWGNPRARHVDFGRPENVGALLEWGAKNAPAHIREGLFDFELPPM
jgi:FADH2 O2-dependent halogenase